MSQNIALTRATLLYGDLDLNDHVSYFLLERGFRYPPPSVKQQYADSALRHGQMPTEAWKYNDRVLQFDILVHGTSGSDLDAKINALFAAVYAGESVVTWCPAGRSTVIYFDARRIPDIDPADYFDTRMRDANEAVVSWQCQAAPFGYTSRQSLYLARNLGVNDSFEKRSGDDFDNFLEEVTGTGTITANTSEYLASGVSAKLTTADTADTTKLTDLDFLPVDAEHHHNAKLFAYKNSGTLTLDFDVLCYNEASALVGTLALLTGYNPAATTWMDVLKVAGSPVIYPYGSPYSPAFPEGTVKVKRQARQDTTIGSVSIDSLYFGDTEYIVGHELEGAMAIMVPAGVCLGDVPAPARIHVGSAYCAGLFSAMGSGTSANLNAIRGYDATHIWAAGAAGTIRFFNGTTWADQSSGTGQDLNCLTALNGSNVWAAGAAGTIRFFNGTAWAGQSLPAYSNLLASLNWSFELGTEYGLPTNWTLDSGYFAKQFGGYEGSYCGIQQQAGSATAYACSAAVAALPGQTFTVEARAKWAGTPESSATATLAVKYYNAAGAYISTDTIDYLTTNSDWQLLSDSTTAPANAATMRVTLSTSGGTYKSVRWDAVTITQTSFPVIYGISAAASNNVFAVGRWGEMFRYTTSWATLASGHAHDLYGAHALDSTHVWAVGAEGCITFYNGTSCSHQHCGANTLRGVYAYDSTHVWAVGDAGTIYFYNGSTWTQQTSGVSEGLYGVWGYDSTHVWAVGANGLILSWNGSTWSVLGSGTANTLRSVYTLATNQVWAAGDAGTILKGVSTVGAMPLTNLVIAQRDDFADAWAAVQDATGATQALLWSRRGQYYRSLAAGGTHKFRFPVGSHAGRYILSIGTSWASSTSYDQLAVKLYLETADGTKISATDVSLAALDLGDPNTKFKETAFQPTRLADITLPSHYVSPNANQDNIYQVIEVTNSGSAPAEWLDCCSLIPAEGAVELSTIAHNFLIFDSEHGEVLSSQDGSFDTAAVFDPTKTVDSPRFEANPAGINMVVLAGNTVSGDERLDPKLDLMMSFEPQFMMIPEAS